MPPSTLPMETPAKAPAERCGRCAGDEGSPDISVVIDTIGDMEVVIELEPGMEVDIEAVLSISHVPTVNIVIDPPSL